MPDKHNILADLPSRKFHDSVKWMLEAKIFYNLIDQFGRQKNYIFASKLKKEIQIYASWLPDPELPLIDAFTILLSMPSHLRVLQKECRKAIIIVPLWTTQSSFTRIMELEISLPIIIPS